MNVWYILTDYNVMVYMTDKSHVTCESQLYSAMLSCEVPRRWKRLMGTAVLAATTAPAGGGVLAAARNRVNPPASHLDYV